MNEVSYQFLKRIKSNQFEQLDFEMLEKIYNYYVVCSKSFQYDILIDRDQMNQFLLNLYQVFSINITKPEFETLTYDYIKLIVCDAKDGEVVDIKWCINHLWYYHFGNEDISEKCHDMIIFAQDKLFQGFGIKENVKQKTVRKIYTSYLINS